MSDITHALTPDQQAARALSFESTKAQLIELAGETGSLVKVDTDDNLAAAKAARARLRTARTTIEKTGKAARDDANKFQKAVIAKERELIGVIQPEEQRLGALIDEEERRREDAARALREAEERRQRILSEAFARVRSLPTLAVNPSLQLADVDTLIAEAQGMVDDVTGFPDELQAAALYEARVALGALKAERDRRVQAEAERAELEALRAEKAAREADLLRPVPGFQSAPTPVSGAPVEGPKLDGDELPPPGAGVGPPRGALAEQASLAREAAVVASREARSGLLLKASRAALAFLRDRGFGQTIVARDLADAIDEADVPGASDAG